MDTRAEVERRLRLQVPDELWKEAGRQGLVSVLEAAANDEEKRVALAELRRFFTRRMEPKAKSDSIYSTTALARALGVEPDELLPNAENAKGVSDA